MSLHSQSNEQNKQDENKDDSSQVGHKVIVKINCFCFFYCFCVSLHSSSDARMLTLQHLIHKIHGFRTFSHFGAHIWSNLPPRHQALRYSLFLQKLTQDISLLRIFQLSHIVCQPYQSVQCVCCLLYTSPSPRDQLSSRMPSSA